MLTTMMPAATSTSNDGWRPCHNDDDDDDDDEENDGERGMPTTGVTLIRGRKRREVEASWRTTTSSWSWYEKLCVNVCIDKIMIVPPRTDKRVVQRTETQGKLSTYVRRPSS